MMHGGDDYSITVSAEDESEARSIATMIDDDANPGKLLKVSKQEHNG